jgi:hypothetical protein
MPLRCLDLTGWSIQSFDLTDEQWRSVELENRKSRSLRMPCCGSQVILKRSHLGTQFFAHKAIGSCVTAPETETHFQLKKTVVDTARANGWEAATEVSGNSPSGEQWTADVLAQKESIKSLWKSNGPARRMMKQCGGKSDTDSPVSGDFGSCVSPDFRSRTIFQRYVSAVI